MGEKSIQQITMNQLAGAVEQAKQVAIARKLADLESACDKFKDLLQHALRVDETLRTELLEAEPTVG
jgi:hypothetical protein